MPVSDTPDRDPIQLKVNPRKWTTKVNFAMAAAVIAILVAGAIYAIYAATHSAEVQEDVDKEVLPAKAR